MYKFILQTCIGKRNTELNLDLRFYLWQQASKVCTLSQFSMSEVGKPLHSVFV